MKEKVIVAISGGIDSAVVAAIANSEGKELYFLTVNYGQKNIKKELKNSKILAKHFKAKEHKIIDMKWLGKLGNSGITDLNIHFENVTDDFIYVPYRNTCIISACVAWAEVIGAELIYTGSEAGPWICPDTSPEYYKAINNLVKISTKLNKKVRVVAPLNESDKLGNIKKGIELGLPFEKTWTCVARDDKACGICQPCRDRLEAFEKAGIKDPIEYLERGEKNEKN
jgi:7-cyano-7-deazaguanine synthase